MVCWRTANAEALKHRNTETLKHRNTETPMVRIIRIWHGGRCEPYKGRRLGSQQKKPRWGAPWRCGLTLIEILIATTLMATLLVALWRLVGIYTSLRDKGDVHAGRVGNVSLMMQQLEEDLRTLPDIRPQAVPRVELVATPREREAEPVASEMLAFEEAYDDEPAVETLSESALELEKVDRSAMAISRDESLALAENQSHAGDTENVNSDQDTQPPDDCDRDQAGLDRSDANCARDLGAEGGQAASSCLVGDEQSLTLANLDCQVSRSLGEGAEKQRQDPLAERGSLPDSASGGLLEGELSAASGYGPSASQDESGSGVTVQMPVRFVRYWLAGVMPLVAQTAAAEQNSDDSEKMGLSARGIGDTQEWEVSGPMKPAGENAVEEAATGLYREEVLGLSTSARMRPLRGRGALENLDADNLSGFDNTSGMAGLDMTGLSGAGLGMAGLDGPGFNSPYTTEDSEEVTRRSFHLAQVEWAKFRYFDGNRWKSSWDSRVQGELPVAIEMSLWLLRRGAKHPTQSVTHEPSSAQAEGMTWTEVETMNATDSQLSASQQDRQDGDANGEQSSLADDSPMERQPEVRQLVVLRTAPLSGDRRPDDGQLGAGRRAEPNFKLSPATSANMPQRGVRP